MVSIIFFIVALIYPTLPNIDHLDVYRPKQPLQVFSYEGYLIQEFGEERRDFVSIKEVNFEEIAERLLES